MKTNTAKSSVWKKFLSLLSHPAWNGVSCFLTALATFGLSSVVIAYFLGVFRKFQELVIWLTQKDQIPRYIVISLIVIFLAAISTLAQRAIFSKRKPKSSIRTVVYTGDFYNFWNVLWKGKYNWLEGMLVSGPFCPKHYLGMSINFSENRYSFYCSGSDGKNGHTISGPKYDELILPEKIRNASSEKFIEFDVSERISAEWRKEGRL